MNDQCPSIRLPRGLEVALVHDWVVQWSGSESVLQSLARVFPGAPVHTLVWDPDEKGRASLNGMTAHPSAVERLYRATGNHRWLLPFMPSAFEAFDLGRFDLVFSSSHAFSKSVRVPESAVHLCYCHTPPRYLWDLEDLYNPGLMGAVRRPLMRRLRRRDHEAAGRVDHFIASSRNVAGRIRRNYGRSARVIYPPVDIDSFVPSSDGPEDYYVAGGRLAGYKRLEIAVEAANAAGLPLKIFGEGPERDRLASLAGPTVELVGRLDDGALAKLLAGARALLLPGEEDFGIVPVEMQAAGRPVVAWDRGGARETVLDGRTGVLYDTPTARGLLMGIERLEAGTWWSHVCRRNAGRFGRERFEEEILEEVIHVLEGRKARAASRAKGRVNGTSNGRANAGSNGRANGRPGAHTNGRETARTNGAAAPSPSLPEARPGANGKRRPRRNLITGGAGFIGSHLGEALVAAGEEVVVVDNLSTGDRGNLEALLHNPRFKFIRGDVMDESLMEDVVRGVDRIFHLAAAVGVKLIMERPVSTVVTNVRGTETMLELASRYRRKILVASTSEVYGKALDARAPDGLLAETDDWTLGPTTRRRWAYACSKAMDEFLALAYRDERDLPVVVARFFNTVGPRQKGRYGMVIPSFVRNALRGTPIVVHGDGTQSRSFTHVADAVRAVLALMDTPEAEGEVVNIGSRTEISINALAERVKRMTGSASEIRHLPYEKVYGPGFEDMQRRTPDISKLAALTGYAPLHDLDGILADVIAFQRTAALPPTRVARAAGVAS